MKKIVLLAATLLVGCDKDLESEIHPHLQKIIGISSSNQAKVKDLYENTALGQRRICGKVSYQNHSSTTTNEFVEFIFDDYDNKDITVNYGKIYNDPELTAKFYKMLSIACPGYK